MKPPPDSKLALYLLYFFMQGLASADDVVMAAGKLDEQELAYFKLVAQISYAVELVEEKVLPMLGRL